MSRALSREAPTAFVATVPRPNRHLRDLAALGLLCGLSVVLLTGYATFRIWVQAGRDDARHAGAIVVLGAAQYDGRPSPVFEARLEHAVALYREGLAPLFVVTGGKQKGDRWTEAETARRYAIAHGVPASAIVMEDRGRTTLESLSSVSTILRARGVDDALFVSDPTHMLRVLRIAEDTGLQAVGSPTQTSPVRELSSRIDATIHELGALAFYFVTGQSVGIDAAVSAAAPGATPPPTPASSSIGPSGSG